jgi:hypothetical protein
MLVVTGQDGECQGKHDRRDEGGGGGAAVRREASHTNGWCHQHEHRQLMFILPRRGPCMTHGTGTGPASGGAAVPAAAHSGQRPHSSA